MMTFFSPALTLFAVLPSIAAAFIQPQTFTRHSASIHTLKNIKAPLQITREEGLWQSSLHASLSEAPAYPEGMSPEEELEYLEKVAEEYFSSQKDEDTPDIDELMKVVASMQVREEPDTEDAIDILKAGCAVAIVIDTIALALSIIGLKGSAPKTVATKMYNKLPRSSKQDLAKIIAKMEMDNFVDSVYGVVKIIKEGLTWNALKQSFSDLGWWDATTFALAFAAIFASGGTAFLINVGLAAAAGGKLIYDITQCEELKR